MPFFCDFVFVDNNNDVKNLFVIFCLLFFFYYNNNAVNNFCVLMQSKLIEFIKSSDVTKQDTHLRELF